MAPYIIRTVLLSAVLGAAPLLAAEDAVSQLGSGKQQVLKQPVAEKTAASTCWDPAEMAKGYESSSYLAVCLPEWESAYSVTIPRTYRSVKTVCASAEFKGSSLCSQYLEIVRKNSVGVSLLPPPKPFKLPKGLTKDSRYSGYWKDCTLALQTAPQNSQYSDHTSVRYSDKEIKDICSDWVANKMAEESNFPAFPFTRSVTFLTQPGPRPCKCTYEDKGSVRTYNSGHGYVVKFMPEDAHCQYAFFKVGMGAFKCISCSKGDAKACLDCLQTAATGIDKIRDGCIQHLCVPIDEFFGTYGPGTDPKCDFERFEQGK